jgi:hypothetical protein
MAVTLFIFFSILVLGFTTKVALGITSRPSAKSIEPPFVDTSCYVWEIRHTQHKMVEAGIIKAVEMSICENLACKDCADTRQAISRNDVTLTRQEIKGLRQDHEYLRWKREHAKTALGGTSTFTKPGEPKPVTVTFTCKSCGMLSTKPECGPCTMFRMEAAQQKRAAEEERNRALTSRNQNHQRVREFGKQSIKIPNGVPSFATPMLAYDPHMLCDYILWEWRYGEDDSVYRRRQNLNTETYEIKAADGTVASAWQEISDPDTGEHLATASLNADGEVEAHPFEKHFSRELAKMGEVQPLQLRVPQYDKGYR